jgi:hypothetical protein
MGILPLYGDPFVMPAATQALMDTDLLTTDPVTVRRMADRDLAVAKALLSVLSERASAFAAEIGRVAFRNVRQRVARHLLDLTAERQRGALLVAAITPSKSSPMRWAQFERSSSVHCAACGGKTCCRPAGAASSSPTRNGCSRKRTEGGT